MGGLGLDLRGATLCANRMLASLVGIRQRDQAGGGSGGGGDSLSVVAAAVVAPVCTGWPEARYHHGSLERSWGHHHEHIVCVLGRGLCNGADYPHLQQQVSLGGSSSYRHVQGPVRGGLGVISGV